MGAAFRLARTILLASTVIGAAWACTPDKPDAESPPQAVWTEEEQVRNELVSETRSELKKWFRFYSLDESADTLFRLRAIWDVSLLTFPVGDNWQQLYQEHPKLFKPSPDKKDVLDIYTYERNFAEKLWGKVQVTADSPDSEVAIVDPENGEKTRLMFCGTPCQFEDAWWRSQHDVVVTGLVQGIGEKVYYPALWHIDLCKNTIRQYTSTQPVPPDNDESYLTDEVFDEL